MSFRSGSEIFPSGLTGTVRVISGEYAGSIGPAKTFTPMHVLDLRLQSGHTDLVLPDGYTTALVILSGALRVEDKEIKDAQVGLFDREGEGIGIDALKETRAILLSGEPIDEPIVGRGPFVMNTSQEIQQAMLDYMSGKMGHLS